MKFTKTTFCILHSAFCIAVAASAAAAATLEPNTRVVYDAVIPNGQGIGISLGRGKERLSISAQNDAYNWSFLDTVGRAENARP